MGLSNTRQKANTMVDPNKIKDILLRIADEINWSYGEIERDAAELSTTLENAVGSLRQLVEDISDGISKP